MMYRELGRSGIEVSALGLGTWAIGGLWWGGNDEQESITAIQTALDEGITLIDTAPMYGYGLAEEIVGKAIIGRDRSKIILATKVGLVWDREEGEYFFSLPDAEVYRNLRPTNIRREIEASLSRLQTDYIDLYQTHWQDASTPIADSMAELMRLQEEGKIRAIGVSNCTTTQMDQYSAVGPLASCQPLYHMLAREAEAELLPYCRQHGIGVLSYSSMAKGLLTGTMDPSRRFGEGDARAGDPRYSPESIRRTNDMLAHMAPYREKYGLNQAQLTLSWTLSRPGMTAALVGTRNPAQVRDVIAGGNVEISPEDLAALDVIIDGLVETGI